MIAAAVDQICDGRHVIVRSGLRDVALGPMGLAETELEQGRLREGQQADQQGCHA